MKTKNYLLLLSFLMVTLMSIACSEKENPCDTPEAVMALRAVLKEQMIKWQDNAKYSDMDDFQPSINAVIDSLTITEIDSKGEDNSRLMTTYMEVNEPQAITCICSAKIQFTDHETFKYSIKEPIAKVRAEEHPLNSAYLRMSRKMNYLDNDGFEFAYILVKNPDEPLKAISFYPYPKADDIDNVGGLLFEYMKYKLGLS